MRGHAEVKAAVKKQVRWWIKQRKKKLEEQLNGTMSVNPFLLPFLFDYHDLTNFEELAELMMASHLMTGHNTGFGKLIDEKILPFVFGAQKLDRAFRRATPPFDNSYFDEIDHILTRPNGDMELLSLKAGRWTIQLTMAVQLNAAFHTILTKHPRLCSRIAVGVFYGKNDQLTDKYDIVRGENRGANHDVADLRKSVHVFAGRDFWAWLNNGEQKTQEWVLEGIISALKEEKINDSAKRLLGKFKQSIVEEYEKDIRTGDALDWMQLLKKING